MRNLNAAFALCAGVGVIAAAAACGSSSSSSKGDAGMGDASVEGGADESGDEGGSADDAADAATCSPTSPDNGCGDGMTCCFDPMSAFSGGIGALASGIKGTCTETSACMSAVQVKCLTAAGCAAGQVCCISGTLAGGADAAASIGAGGLAGLASFNAITTCETTCPAGQTQACKATSDCIGLSAGMVCSPASLGPLGGLAGGEGGLGGLGGLAAGLLGGLATEMVCSTPEAGAPTPDAGAPDSAGPDAGTADAADSGGPDAPVD